jgi:hypothetical protein
VELFQAGHINDNVGLRRVSLGVIFLGCADDQFDDIRKAAATAATFFHGMVNFYRHDKLPAILIEHLEDRVSDFPVGNVIATANQHSRSTLET